MMKCGKHYISLYDHSKSIDYYNIDIIPCIYKQYSHVIWAVISGILQVVVDCVELYLSESIIHPQPLITPIPVNSSAAYAIILVVLSGKM